MAALMHNRPADLLLSLTIMYSFDASESSKVLAQLSVDDVMVELVSPEFTDLKQVEPWYGTEFGTEVITAEICSAWAGSSWASPFLRLPSLNVYIPETFELLGTNATEPRQVV
jgi:secreted Zn-dependent insulinase-like peptidase